MSRHGNEALESPMQKQKNTPGTTNPQNNADGSSEEINSGAIIKIFFGLIVLVAAVVAYVFLVKK
jgi:hypothetical protein